MNRTNQTTLECLTPFLLLRYLPRVSEPSSIAGNPRSENDTVDGLNTSINGNGVLREHMLSSAQRRHVRIAHHFIRIYDVGWARNWGEVFGLRGRGRWGWIERILCGGSTCVFIDTASASSIMSFGYFRARLRYLLSLVDVAMASISRATRAQMNYWLDLRKSLQSLGDRTYCTHRLPNTVYRSGGRFRLQAAYSLREDTCVYANGAISIEGTGP